MPAARATLSPEECVRRVQGHDPLIRVLWVSGEALIQHLEPRFQGQGHHCDGL